MYEVSAVVDVEHLLFYKYLRVYIVHTYINLNYVKEILLQHIWKILEEVQSFSKILMCTKLMRCYHYNLNVYKERLERNWFLQAFASVLRHNNKYSIKKYFTCKLVYYYRHFVVVFPTSTNCVIFLSNNLIEQSIIM